MHFIFQSQHRPAWGPNWSARWAQHRTYGGRVFCQQAFSFGWFGGI